MQAESYPSFLLPVLETGLMFITLFWASKPEKIFLCLGFGHAVNIMFHRKVNYTYTGECIARG